MVVVSESFHIKKNPINDNSYCDIALSLRIFCLNHHYYLICFNRLELHPDVPKLVCFDQQSEQQ